jgi:hypothetical protein
VSSDIIDKWSSQLPLALRSDRYHLFHNGLQLLNETVNICGYGLKDGVVFFFLGSKKILFWSFF